VVYASCAAGNPRESEDLVFTECWDDKKSVTVRIGDSCPCNYPIRDPTTQKVVENRTQPWCCGGNNHFDLSFWAFEQLAHPSYGVIPIEYRPVNCESGAPLR
jgi:cullin-associated NEDD8-dissociated protein 1